MAQEKEGKAHEIRAPPPAPPRRERGEIAEAWDGIMPSLKPTQKGQETTRKAHSELRIEAELGLAGEA